MESVFDFSSFFSQVISQFFVAFSVRKVQKYCYYYNPDKIKNKIKIKFKNKVKSKVKSRVKSKVKNVVKYDVIEC
jgi:hypothetical protein